MKRPAPSTGHVPEQPVAKPFAISGHAWVPVDWLPKLRPEDVIMRTDDIVLVRTGNTAEARLPVKREPKATRKPSARSMASRGIDELFSSANEGNQASLHSLVDLLTRSVARLTKLSEERASLVRPVAKKSIKWPVLVSIHPLLCDHFEKSLESIALGKDLPLFFDKFSKWKLDEFTQIAARLLFHIWKAKREHRGTIEYQSLGEVADALPPFEDGPCADQWWSIAEVIFRLSYPAPESLPELARLVVLKSRSPGRIRAKIHERLKQRFLNLAKP